MKVTFTRFLHDRDGDIYDEGIWLYFNSTTGIRINDELELLNLIENLQNIKKEISEQPF